MVTRTKVTMFPMTLQRTTVVVAPSVIDFKSYNVDFLALGDLYN
jgi:hypothetical protein